MNSSNTFKNSHFFHSATRALLLSIATLGLATTATADTSTNVCQSTMESDPDHPTLMEFSSARSLDEFNTKFPEVAITDTSNRDVQFENNRGITSKNKDRLNSDRIIFKNGGKASVTFLTEGAGYSHLFGYFRIKDVSHYFEYEKDLEGNIVTERLRDCDHNGIPDFHEDLFSMRDEDNPRTGYECEYIDRTVCEASSDKNIRACEHFNYFKGNKTKFSLLPRPSSSSRNQTIETISYPQNYKNSDKINYGKFYHVINDNNFNDGGTYKNIHNLLEPPAEANNYAGVGRIIFTQSDYYAQTGSNLNRVNQKYFYDNTYMDSSYDYNTGAINNMNWDLSNHCFDGRKAGNNNDEWCTIRTVVPQNKDASLHSLRVELKEDFEPGEEIVFFLIVATTDDNNHVCLAPNWKTGQCDYVAKVRFMPVFSKPILNASSMSTPFTNWESGFSSLINTGKTIVVDEIRPSEVNGTDPKIAWFFNDYITMADTFIPTLEYRDHIQPNNQGQSSTYFKATNDALSKSTTGDSQDKFPRFPHAFAANFSWNPYFWILGFEDQTQNGAGDWDYEDVAFIIETNSAGSVRSEVITGDAASSVTSGNSICQGKDCDGYSITNVSLKIKDLPHRTKLSDGEYSDTSDICKNSIIYYDLATDCELWSNQSNSYVTNSSPKWRRIDNATDCARDTVDPSYNNCQVNMSLEGFTGSRLCWRAQFISTDEGRCLPLLQAMDVRYDMMRPGSYSRSSPTSMANGIFYGSWELAKPSKQTCNQEEQLMDLDSATCFPVSTRYQTQTLDYTARGHFIFRDLYDFNEDGQSLTCSDNCTDPMAEHCKPVSQCWNWNSGEKLAERGIVAGSGSAHRKPSKASGIGSPDAPTRVIYTSSSLDNSLRILPQTGSEYDNIYTAMMSLAQKEDGTYDSTYDFNGDRIITPASDGPFLTQWLHGWENKDLTAEIAETGGAGSLGIVSQCNYFPAIDESINCCNSCCQDTTAGSNGNRVLNCSGSCLTQCKKDCCEERISQSTGHCKKKQNKKCDPYATACPAGQTCIKIGYCQTNPHTACMSSSDCPGGNQFWSPECIKKNFDASYQSDEIVNGYRCNNMSGSLCQQSGCDSGDICVKENETRYFVCEQSCLNDFERSNDNNPLTRAAETIRAWPMGAFEFSTAAIVGPPNLNPKLPMLERANYTNNYLNALYNSNKDRPAVAYIGGSDGMLHAFDAGIFRFDKRLHDNDQAQKGAFKNKDGVNKKGTGQEIFAFIPRKQLNRLVNNYIQQAPAASAESSPTVADIDLGYNKAWTRSTDSTLGAMTALTMAAGKDSPVVFALDVTDVKYVENPTTSTNSQPRVLWEVDLENDLIYKHDGEEMTLPQYVKAINYESKFTNPTIELDTSAARHSPTLARLNFVSDATDMTSADNARWTAIYSSDYGDGNKIGAIHIIDMLTGLPVITNQTTGKVIAPSDIVNGNVNMNQKNMAGLYLLNQGEGVSGEIPSVDVNEDGIGDVLYVPTTQGRIYKINPATKQMCIFADLHEDLKSYAEEVQKFTALDGSGQILRYGQELSESSFVHQNIFSSIAVSLDNAYRVKVYAATGNNPDIANDPADNIPGLHFWLVGLTDSTPKNAQPGGEGRCVSGYSAITATPLIEGQSVWGGVAISNSGTIAATTAAGASADACHLKLGEGSGYLYQFDDPANLQTAGESLKTNSSGGGTPGSTPAVSGKTTVQSTDAPVMSAPIFVNGQVIAISATAKLETIGDGNFNQAPQFDSFINMLNWQRLTDGKLSPANN